MTSKMADMEGLLCPMCQNEIPHDLLEKLNLDVSDLAIIENLLHENLLMQIVELGKLASKYFKPETITTEVQVQDSLRKLSEKASDLIEKQRQLVNDLARNGEQDKIKLTQDAIQKQRDLIAEFQTEIRTMQEQRNKIEQDHKDELTRMNSALVEIQKKIVGVGIGHVGEIAVAKELKSACPEDDFSDERAAKGETDIIGKVRVKGNEMGSIVVSVKREEKWKGEFVEQIKKNLRQEQTEWGILVLKVFPSSALNDKMYLDSNGIMFVKSEYAAAAYLGIRHAVIHKQQVQAFVNSQQAKDGLQEQVIGVLREWVQGDKVKEIFAKIEQAKSASVQTEELMHDLQNYNEKTINKARELQTAIRGSLQQSSQIVSELQEKLPIK
jgi:hypothetical protein